MDPLPPVAELNNTMAKVRVVPRYTLVFREAKYGRETFMMQVTCPLTPNGKPLTAFSQYCVTQKEAKHSAALAFMEKFLYRKSEPQDLLQQAYPSRREDDRIYYEKLEKLETICFKNNLEQPMYWDVGAEGPEHCLTWIIECHAAGLITEGRGRRKVEARTQATRRMIEMLMKTGSNYESFEAPESTTPAYDHGIVSSSDDPRGRQPEDHNCVFNEEKSDPSKSETRPASDVYLAEAPRARRNLNTAETLRRWLDDRKSDTEMKESQHDSGVNLKAKDLDKDFQPEISSTKSSSPCLNKDPLDCVDSGVESSSSPDPPRKLTRLQAVSRMNRILRTFEKELYQNILDALAHTNLSHRATVRILCREYVVFIKQDSPFMIFEEHYECTDQSIRVACLTRLLLDLMERVTKG